MPDNSSLLVRLQKYAPRGKNNPKENFLTEAFVWVLEKCPEFAEKFVRELNTKAREKDQSARFDTDPEHWEWKTQVTLKSSRPDIVGKNNKYQCPDIIIEVKFESEPDYKQLQCYKEEYEKEHKSSNAWVFLLHPGRQGVSQKIKDDFPVATWERVDEITREVWHDFNSGKADYRGEQFFFIDEFRCLLDEFGLYKKTLLSNIPDEYENFFKGGEEMYILNAFSTSFKVVNDLQDAFKRAADKIKFKNDDKFKFDNRWGRLGISLCTTKWNPGFFAGIIVNPWDHELDKAPEYEKAEGSEQIQQLYFCIVISVDREYWHKKENASYKEFKKRVEDTFIEDGYTPYTPNNKWHPIILYKKLDDVADAIDQEIPIEEGLSRITEDIYKKILKRNNLDTLDNALDELERRYNQQQKNDA